jgi:hypothetical protein
VYILCFFKLHWNQVPSLLISCQGISLWINVCYYPRCTQYRFTFSDPTSVEWDRNSVWTVEHDQQCTKIHCLTVSGPSRDQHKHNAIPSYMQIHTDIAGRDQTVFYSPDTLLEDSCKCEKVWQISKLAHMYFSIMYLNIVFPYSRL